MPTGRRKGEKLTPEAYRRFLAAHRLRQEVMGPTPKRRKDVQEPNLPKDPGDYTINAGHRVFPRFLKESWDD